MEFGSRSRGDNGYLQVNKGHENFTLTLIKI
jgi:hypothetical protein